MDITKRNKIKRISIIIVSIIIAVFFIIKVMPAIFFAGLSAYVDYQKSQNQKLLDKNGVKTLPCEPASSVELGSPSFLNGKTAEFTTAGGTIYVKPRIFSGGGWIPPFSSAEIFVGYAATPPIYDAITGITTNVLKRLEFNKTDYGILDLPADRYWLWSGEGGDIILYSCEEGGVSDPKPVRR
jgi:hypothetical protein